MEKIKEHTPKLISKCAAEGKVLEKIKQGHMFLSVCVCVFVYVHMQLYGCSVGRDGKHPRVW